jgi:hypothetical protein
VLARLQLLGQKALELGVLLVEDPGGCVASTRELPRSLQDLLQHRVVVELGRQRTANLQPATKPALINLDAGGGLTLDRVHHAGD